MRPISLRLRGVTRFTDELHLDLEHLPPGLVCFEGPNGEGKTTIMEALGPAALWREWPSKPGTMLDSMHGRDARLHLVLEHGGSRYDLELLGDTAYSAGRGKLEAFLRRDGVPVTAERCPDYDQAVAELFPSRLVFMASAYAAQNGAGNFRSLGKAERRDLFSALLGNEHLQRQAERARALAADAGALLDAIEAQAADLVERRARALELDRQAASNREALPVAEQAVAEQVARHQALQLEHAGLVAALRQLEQAREQAVRTRDRLANLVRTLEGDRTRISELIAGDEAVVAKADQVRADAQALEHASREVARLLADHRAAGATASAARRDLDASRKRQGELQRDVTALALTIAAGEAAADQLPQLEADAQAAAAHLVDLTSSEARRNEARRVRNLAEVAHRTADTTAARDHARAAAALEASERQAALLGGVPCGGKRLQLEVPDDGDSALVVDCGACRFLTDAQAAAAALEGLRRALALADEAVLVAARLEADLQVARADEQVADQAHQQLEARGRALAGAGARLEAARGLQAQGLLATTRRDELVAEQGRLAELVPDLEADLVAADALVAQLVLEGNAARATTVRLAGADQRLQQLEAAVARLPERRAALERLVADLAQRNLELGEVVVPDEPVAAREQARLVGLQVQAALEAKAQADRLLRGLREAVARLEGQRLELGDLEAEHQVLERQRQALTRRRQGLRLLERALGRDGVQALEIDAAAPRVSALANDLLLASYGARFNLVLQTIRAAEGNRKAREVFDVIVHDADRPGGARAIESYSGGEAVLLDEALKLALALFNAERHSVQVATLWRDECDGKLDAENARRYPPMLRRALQLGGFRNVFYVSHRDEVIAQADAVVHVEGGRARLEVVA